MIVLFHGEAVAFYEKAGDPPAPAQRGKAKFRAAAVTCLEPGTEDPGQGADVLSDQEVVLHESFDIAGPGMGGVAEARGDRHLHVEGQALLGAAG